MEQCVFHDKKKDECRASGLYCFYADPKMHINCIALNNAYKFGVATGVRICTNIASKQLQDYIRRIK